MAGIANSFNCWRRARTSWECGNIAVTRQRETRPRTWVSLLCVSGCGRVSESQLRQMNTVLKWNRISFSRLRWHPGQQILTARPCKRGNNIPQIQNNWPLSANTRSGSSQYAAEERTIMSGLWPPGHPFSSGCWLMFIMALVIMGC